MENPGANMYLIGVGPQKKFRWFRRFDPETNLPVWAKSQWGAHRFTLEKQVEEVLRCLLLRDYVPQIVGVEQSVFLRAKSRDSDLLTVPNPPAELPLPPAPTISVVYEESGTPGVFQFSLLITPGDAYWSEFWVEVTTHSGGDSETTYHENTLSLAYKTGPEFDTPANWRVLTVGDDIHNSGHSTWSNTVTIGNPPPPLPAPPTPSLTVDYEIDDETGDPQFHFYITPGDGNWTGFELSIAGHYPYDQQSDDTIYAVEFIAQMDGRFENGADCKVRTIGDGAHNTGYSDWSEVIEASVP